MNGEGSIQEAAQPGPTSDLLPRDESPRRPATKIELVCAADIQPQAIDWLWQGWLARGKLTIISGDPSMGKSQVSLDIASRLSNGDHWPDGGRSPIGSTIILSAEDDAADTIKPRLMAANANASRVHIVSGVTRAGGKSSSFRLGEDLSALEVQIKALGDVALVILDPITSYMGDVDSHRTTDVRGVLEPLTEWAARLKIAVLAISHPPKASQTKAMNSVTGSLAYVAAARMVFVAVRDPGAARSLLLPVKNNFGPTAGLGYRISPRQIEGGINTSAIDWDQEPVDVTADEVMGQEDRHRNSSRVGEAEEFLEHHLADGPRRGDETELAAKAAGISLGTLRRAKRSLGVKSRRSGFGGGRWTWELPSD